MRHDVTTPIGTGPGDDFFVFDPSESAMRARNKMLSSVVVPRPIAMISTAGPDDALNVAPYSYYQPITWLPMLIGVAFGRRGADRRRDADVGGRKDTCVNALAAGDFVVNVTTEAFRGVIEHAATEFPPDVSEFDHVPWTPTSSLRVSSPSIAEAPARLECTVHKVIELGEGEGEVTYVVGEVQCIVVQRSLLVEESWIDDLALQPIGRLGGRAFLRTIPEAVYEEQRVRYEPPSVPLT